jgi:hypothetical protein
MRRFLEQHGILVERYGVMTTQADSLKADDA